MAMTREELKKWSKEFVKEFNEKQEQVDRQINLLRRAWDTLDTFKQAYPENWNEEDEQLLNDLIKEDLRLSGVELREEKE